MNKFSSKINLGRFSSRDLDHMFFTADQHFNHSNIIRLCDRPFDDVDHMQTEMIRRWNFRVDPNDVVYVLGDFYMGRPTGAREMFARLNGNIHVIPGGHDKWIPTWDATYNKLVSKSGYVVQILP